MYNSLIEDMKSDDKEWLKTSAEKRITTLLSFSKPLPKTCPECDSEITYSDEDQCEAYCTKCGLVTSASIRYVAGQKIDLPYGLRL